MSSFHNCKNNLAWQYDDLRAVSVVRIIEASGLAEHIQSDTELKFRWSHSLRPELPGLGQIPFLGRFSVSC